MDISKIRAYLAYEPVVTQTPQQFFDTVMRSAHAAYLTTSQRKEVKKAFDFANNYHHITQRLSGELYMMHPIKVMEFLLELHPDVASLQTALLHDVIEDTAATYEEVKKLFGEEVAELCVALEKVAKVKYRGEERSIETLKKMFLAMGKDLRVILVKLADRVHNIQTLHFHPNPEKRKRIAEETLKVYVPIAKRLGLYVFQGLLENGAFYQLDPKEYKRISDWLTKVYGDIDHLKTVGIERLEKICSLDGVVPKVVLGRLKSPYRIHTKLQKYGTTDISKIMDVLAFRIITGSIADCYSDLGAIHKHYTPIFAKMKDYIAIPKPNGYKSLHTTVLGMFSFPVEIQIRTEEMDTIANYGVAAHFAYSDSDDRESVNVSAEQAAWIERLQKLVSTYQENNDKEGFKRELHIEMLEKNIFVYTPKGDIIELPQGSTVLDFAFRVHSDVGLRFRHALINSKIVPIDIPLKTGDIVDIALFKHKYTATRAWLRFLHTPSAKNKLNKFLRHVEREELVKEMEQLVNVKLKEYGLPLLNHKDDKILKTYPGEQREQLLYKIRDKQLSLTRMIRGVYGEHVGHQHSATETREGTQQAFDAEKIQVVIDGDKVLPVVFCPECEPTPGTSIIGRSGKDGIKIHLVTCHALQTIEAHKLLSAHRYTEEPTQYFVEFFLSMYDAPGVLLDLLKMFEYLNINVHALSTAESNTEGWKKVTVQIELANPAKLAFIIQEIKNKKHIAKLLETTFVSIS